MMTQILLMVVFMFAVTTYALRNGGQPERSVALLLFGTSVIDFFYHLLMGPPQFVTVDPFHLVLDFIVWSAFRGLPFGPIVDGRYGPAPRNSS